MWGSAGRASADRPRRSGLARTFMEVAMDANSDGPRVETWVSSLMLSPRETEKLVIYQVAELARRRKERGLKLNLPEAIAMISEALLEAARDDKSVAET